jgi:hypothetical protein
LGALNGSDRLFSQTTPFDLFHTNSVEPVEAPHPVFERGELLVSLRNLSLIAVFNPWNRKVVWETDRLTFMQHQPGFLPNGNILVFDNGMPSSKSRIVEIDPRTKKIVWQYRSPDFYAENRGGVQRLSNGNTLITESPEGRVFEITREGKVVWEFYTPEIRRAKRGVIYRMTRYSSPDADSVLLKLTELASKN